MKFFHSSIGGGITGIETIISCVNMIKKDFKKKKIKKKFIFAIIDKEPSNIPGGVAYGFQKSIYGYFNNPLRLSPPKFVNWILKKKNKRILVDYLTNHGGYTGKQWLNKNKKMFNSYNYKNHKELYVPRVMMNYWMQERFISTLKIIEKNKDIFQLKIFKGEVIDVKKDKDYFNLIFKNNFCEEQNYKILNDQTNQLSFEKKYQIKKKIISKNLNIGLGLPPPNQIANFHAQNNLNYIWDFYDKGSTNYLIKKIIFLSKTKKKIVIYFVGYKAGLLEALPELAMCIDKYKLKIRIICSSSELQSIQEAELSKNKKKYSTKFFKKSLLVKINTAEKLFYSINKEFSNAINNGYNKYDAWTYILRKNIIFQVIKKFSLNEKKKYDDFFHDKIRSITRFTYPETIKARELLFKKKILIAKKEKVQRIYTNNKFLIVKTINKSKKIKKYNCDIVVNVSGPLNAQNIKDEIPLIKNLKKMGAKTISGGFHVNNNFEIVGLSNIYVPGILSRGFNPERKTIINAILKNSNSVAIGIRKGLLKSKNI